MCLFTHLSPASAILAISLKNYSVSLQDCWFHQIIIFAGSWWQSRVSRLVLQFWLTLKFPLHQASILESATCSKKKFPHHNFRFDSGVSRKWLETSKCDRVLLSFIVAAGILPFFFYQPFFFLPHSAVVQFKFGSFQSELIKIRRVRWGYPLYISWLGLGACFFCLTVFFIGRHSHSSFPSPKSPVCCSLFGNIVSETW